MTDHASWCTHHADSGCRSAKILAGDAGVRLAQRPEAESSPTLMVTHGGLGTGYPCLLLPFREAADFAALMRALGHDDIAAALEQLLTGAGAILTEEYGRQRWEVPS